MADSTFDGVDLHALAQRVGAAQDAQRIDYVGRQRARQLHHLAHAVRQAGHQQVAVALQVQQLDHALDGVQVGANAPLVYITNDNATKWSPPLMVCAVEDPLSAGAVIDGTDLMGQVWLRGVPPSYEVLVDCAHRRILKRETGTTVWETAEDLIDARSGVPTYPYVTDTDGFVIVRPSFLGDHLSDVLVTIESVRRYGCC